MQNFNVPETLFTGFKRLKFSGLKLFHKKNSYKPLQVRSRLEQYSRLWRSQTFSSSQSWPSCRAHILQQLQPSCRRLTPGGHWGVWSQEHDEQVNEDVACNNTGLLWINAGGVAQVCFRLTFSYKNANWWYQYNLERTWPSFCELKIAYLNGSTTCQWRRVYRKEPVRFGWSVANVGELSDYAFLKIWLCSQSLHFIGQL